VVKRSAGILLYRWRDGALEVLLGHPGGPYFARKDDGVWTIPKGELDPGEDELAAAHREFAEEMGSAPPDGDPVPLGETVQSNGKIAVVWALEGDLDASAAVCNLFEMEWPPKSGRMQSFPEIDRAGWFDIATARRKAFASQQPFFDRLEQHLAETRLP
jgi:predicted NUDIX family NTP pyrophosphohydrolase